MKYESRPKAAPENTAVAAGSSVQDIADALLNDEIHPHEMPWDLWRIWSDGFRAGQDRMQPRLDRANADADHWYVASKWTPTQIAQLQRDASLEGKHIDWHRGVLV